MTISRITFEIYRAGSLAATFACSAHAVLLQVARKEEAVPLEGYLARFVHLLVVPFDNLGTAWPILPIYTSLILGELYKGKVSFGHTVGNGFTLLWAGLSWARHLSQKGIFEFKVLPWIVAGSAIGLGVFAIVLGIRKKDKALCEILGHTRFSCYFIITFYPMQAGLAGVGWSWPNMAAILIFALPCWFLIYLLGRTVARFVQ